MSGPPLIYSAYVMYINYCITLFVMNNVVSRSLVFNVRGDLFDCVPNPMVFDGRGD